MSGGGAFPKLGPDGEPLVASVPPPTTAWPASGVNSDAATAALGHSGVPTGATEAPAISTKVVGVNYTGYGVFALTKVWLEKSIDLSTQVINCILWFFLQ